MCQGPRAFIQEPSLAASSSALPFLVARGGEGGGCWGWGPRVAVPADGLPSAWTAFPQLSSRAGPLSSTDTVAAAPCLISVSTLPSPRALPALSPACLPGTATPGPCP